MQINSHLSVLVHNLAKKWGEKTALTFRKFGSDQWQSVSFNLFSLRVKQVSNALLNLGAKPLDKIAVFSQNCVHYLYTDFGAYGIRVTGENCHNCHNCHAVTPFGLSLLCISYSTKFRYL